MGDYFRREGNPRKLKQCKKYEGNIDRLELIILLTTHKHGRLRSVNKLDVS